MQTEVQAESSGCPEQEGLILTEALKEVLGYKTGFEGARGQVSVKLLLGEE